MIQAKELTYDEMPYPQLSHYSTHPDCLATMAVLAGLQPAPVEACRVLELGCASGGNLIPMAYCLPKSTFVGVDLSETQISDGQKQLKALGLTNLKLHALDILDITKEFGEFDYIIAHGVFSWVPPAVQDKVLAICRENLAPQGIGFISYNTFPGWHLIQVVRNMMRYHTRDIADPLKRAAEARRVLRMFANAKPEPMDDGYYGFIRMYADYLDGVPGSQLPKYDSALLHDELEELNQPFYFHEFVERLEASGLQYLADLSRTNLEKIDPIVVGDLRKKAKNLVEIEQSADFLLNRTFRKTLVCQKSAVIQRRIKPGQIARLLIGSHASAEKQEIDYFSTEVTRFEAGDGSALTTDHPLSKAAMLSLAEAWPKLMNFRDVFKAAQNRLVEAGYAPNDLQQTQDRDAQVLSANLLKAFSYSSSLVDLHVFAPPLDDKPNEFPVVSRPARLNAVQGQIVTNLRHERVDLDAFDRFILPRLDGSRNRKSLLTELKEGPLAHGALTFEVKGEKIPAGEEDAALELELDHHLKWYAVSGLLVDTSILGEVDGH